jgi:hypothetical protein
MLFPEFIYIYIIIGIFHVLNHLLPWLSWLIFSKFSRFNPSETATFRPLKRPPKALHGEPIDRRQLGHVFIGGGQGG